MARGGGRLDRRRVRAGRADPHRPGLGPRPTVFGRRSRADGQRNRVVQGQPARRPIRAGADGRAGGLASRPVRGADRGRPRPGLVADPRRRPDAARARVAGRGAPAPGDAWPAVLRYARLQADLAPHAADLLSLGLADLRPGSVPGQFEKLLASPHIEAVVGPPDGITHGQYERLRGLGPLLRELCAELDALGLPASLDHADVHPGKHLRRDRQPLRLGRRRRRAPVLQPPGRPADRGRARGSSPRSTRSARPHRRYLGPWLEAGYGRAAVDRSLSLALRIAPLARALTWGRLFPCYLGHPAPSIHAARAWPACSIPTRSVWTSPRHGRPGKRFLFRGRPVYLSEDRGVSAKGTR